MPVDPAETDRMVMEMLSEPISPEDLAALKAANPNIVEHDPNELITFKYSSLLTLIFLVVAQLTALEDACDLNDDEAIMNDGIAALAYIQQKIKEYRQPTEG